MGILLDAPVVEGALPVPWGLSNRDLDFPGSLRTSVTLPVAELEYKRCNAMPSAAMSLCNLYSAGASVGKMETQSKNGNTAHV